MGSGLVSLGVLLTILGCAFLLYNQLDAHRNTFRSAFSLLEVQLQRRYALIPNLLDAVKHHLKPDGEVLTIIAVASDLAAEKCDAAGRNPDQASLIGALAEAEAELTDAMGKLIIVLETHPDLKTYQRMADLQEQLTTTENRIAFARQAYCDAVIRYNALRGKFPSNLVANLFGFKQADLFQLEPGKARASTKVSFA